MSRIVSRNLFAYVLILMGATVVVNGADNPSNEKVKEGTILSGETLSNCLQEMERVWQEYPTAGAIPDPKVTVITATRQLHTKASDKIRLSTEQFVETCYDCATRITSEDFGKDRFELSQQILIGSLPYLDAVPTELAVRTVCAMSSGFDPNGEPLNPGTLRAYRKTYVRCHLRAWERVESDIDPTWKVDPHAKKLRGGVSPPGYPPGTRPEEIKEPDLRAKYEAIWKELERNAAQGDARRLKMYYLPDLKESVGRMYAMEPVTDDDLDLLKAYLRIHVADAKLRKELFEIAQSAAKAKHGEPAKSPSVGNLP